MNSRNPVPRYSILIPSRNRLDLLKSAVASVLSQQGRDYEIVISDNCSDEDYSEFVATLDADKVHYSRSATALSVTENWNRALELARGDYIIMLGDDDALTPGMLARLDTSIERYDEPDCVYVMAYNYAYPDAIADRPTGYFCRVNNSPLFDRVEPYLLPSTGRDATRDGLRFHHSVSFNAQHFVWRRTFTRSVAQPFFQSPYPDYYACFMTFALASRIVVDPRPEVIIGISTRSFGHYFSTGSEAEGFKQFLAPDIDVANLASGDPETAAALDLPGSRHYRNWLCAALATRKVLGSESPPVDLARYRLIQIHEIAFRAAFLNELSASALAKLGKRLSRSDRARLLLTTRALHAMRRAGIATASEALQAIAKLLRIHAPATIHEYDIGPHASILDAYRWIEDHARTEDAQGPASPPVLDARELHIQKLTRSLQHVSDAITAKDEVIQAQGEAIVVRDTVIQEQTSTIAARDKTIGSEQAAAAILAQRLSQVSAQAQMLQKERDQFELRAVLSTAKSAYLGRRLARAQSNTIGKILAKLPWLSRDRRSDALNARIIRNSGLFDAAYYHATNSDVPLGPDRALTHFIQHGSFEGRRPNRMFDPSWYLRTNGDVANSGINPLLHFIQNGAAERRDPGPDFSTSTYCDCYPDVAASGMNPLAHFLEYGEAEGRCPKGIRVSAFVQDPVTSAGGIQGASLPKPLEGTDLTSTTLLRMDNSALAPILNYFLPFKPLNSRIEHQLNAVPTLRILLPSVQKRHATGGPNTAFLLGALLAREGVRVAFVSTDVGLDDDLGLIVDHVTTLSGFSIDDLGITFEDASDRSRPYPIGINDVFMATAWWTAQAVAGVIPSTKQSRMLYLVQDYETLFYGASENYVSAETSYDIPHQAIVNTSLLRDHLVENRIGQFGDVTTADSALVFEPAIDDTRFYPAIDGDRKKRKLLFYARPTVARRNLFGLGVAALTAAVASGLFAADEWEFVGMGEHFEPIDLGSGQMLSPAPWLDFDGYAAQMRGADILLSLMLSPHPSYPPLEMAACGRVTVTTEFGSKTAARLHAISPLIIGVSPTIDDLVMGLARALAMSRHTKLQSKLTLPATWQESLSLVLPGILAFLAEAGRFSPASTPRLPALETSVRLDQAEASLAQSNAVDLQRRNSTMHAGSSTHRLSIITTVYDTAASFLVDLAHSILGQTCDLDFEWLILDNGSSRVETKNALALIAEHPVVRLVEVPENLGIVGGMRLCLEEASRDYVLPVDSDDLLFPDCLKTIGAFLEQKGFPKAIYTDEDKYLDGAHRDRYQKPDWDPVLFIHSCYIAHLTVLDRKTALDIGCYSDREAEGCHDWDTFNRLLFAGITPLHLPEVLYSWRMHHGSTAGNIHSKPFINASHRFVLERFVRLRGAADTVDVAQAPLFGTNPDYRFVAKAPLTSNAVIVSLAPQIRRSELRETIAGLGDEQALVCLKSTDVTSTFELASEEATVLASLFSDVAVLGGRIVDGRTVLEAGYVFGFAGAIGCPDTGRAIEDPGYFAQMWKPRSVAAVSARLCWVDRRFLMEAVDHLPDTISLNALGPWLGALARRRGRRVVCSPYIGGVSSATNVALDAPEKRAFIATFGDLLDDRVGYSPRLSLEAGRGYQPGLEAARRELADYQPEAGSKVVRPTSQGRRSDISLLTTVYARTDPDLFIETVSAVAAQLLPAREWIVLAHGPVPDRLKAILDDLHASGRIRLVVRAENLGIAGGLRVCLEEASGSFVISLDADDLLEPTALQTIDAHIQVEQSGRVFYSDEDLLVGGRRQSPFYRPDFDPTLLQAHSYVWHLICAHRETALELGVYTNRAAEYAQDWDTLLRFHRAGLDPVHIRSILYSWRQHERSLSNSGETFSGSLDSVANVLDGIRTSLAAPHHFAVESYPIDLGAPDFYLRRLPVDPPSVALVHFAAGQAQQRVVERLYSFASSTRLDVRRGPDGVETLARCIGGSTSDMVLLLGPSIDLIGPDDVWHALRHFELSSTCAAVGGPIARLDGRMIFGGVVQLPDGRLVDPMQNRMRDDPGRFSLALKPHSVCALTPDLMLVERGFLVNALASAGPTISLRHLGLYLGRAAWASGLRLVYEPLLRGVFTGHLSQLVGDDVEGLSRVPAVMDGDRPPAAPLLGSAGFAHAERFHGV